MFKLNEYVTVRQYVIQVTKKWRLEDATDYAGWNMDTRQKPVFIAKMYTAINGRTPWGQ